MKRVLLVVFSFFLAGHDLSAQFSDTTLWSPNGPVHSLYLRDSLLYVGGDFSQVSPVTGHLVAVDSVTGQYQLPFPMIDGVVNCLEKDSQNYLYVGGKFTHVGVLPFQNLFRITPQGNVDPNWHPDPNDEVLCLKKFNSLLYVGGNFTFISGTNRSRGAALDSLGDANGFDAQANGPIYVIYPEANGFNVVIGGAFTSSGGSPIPYLEKLQAASGNFLFYGNSFWSAQPGINGPVRAIHEQNGLLYVAGDFTAFASFTRKGLGVVDSYSGLLQSPDAGINGKVNDMEFINNRIYFCGNFGIVDGQFRAYLAAVDTSFNVLDWNPDANKPVLTLMPSEDSTFFYVGGNFNLMGGDSLYHAAAVDTAGLGSVHSWNPMADGPVYAFLPMVNGRVFMAGDFQGVNGIVRPNLCAININTKRPNTWNPAPNGSVETIYVNNNEIFIAGNFVTVGNQFRDNMASFTLSNHLLTAFDPGVNGLVRTMVSDGNYLYVGGNFSTIGGEQRANLACLDISNAQATVWNPECTGTVNKLILANGYMYVAGFYSVIAGQNRMNLARLHTTTGAIDWNWQCDTDNGVYDLSMYNGILYAGGWFDHARGFSRSHLAAMDTITGALLSFDPGTDNYVRCMTHWNDDLFFSGAFDILGAGLNYPRLGNYDLGDQAFDSWSPSPNDMPVTMQASQDWLYIGGSFLNAGYEFHPNLSMIYVMNVTGLDDQESPNQLFFLFPNPAQDVLQIQWSSNTGSCQILVTDFMGRKVYSANQAGTFAQLDISTWAMGMYSVELINENGERLVVRRFIKN
jgi:Secretion system C-terminal sorting domain/Domain of unknown function (DUF5122) beta-propeller